MSSDARSDARLDPADRALPPHRRLLVAVRSRGILRVAQSCVDVVADAFTDRRFHVDTGGRRSLSQLTISGSNIEHGQRYQPTRYLHVRRVLRLVEPNDRTTLVDFGSGQGRVLIAAAELGFTSVRGVEFAAELCDSARRNLEAYSRRRRPYLNSEILELDAACYEIRRDETVFYFANPFGPTVLGPVLDNIARSLASNPRTAWLFYTHPQHPTLITEHTPFEEVARETWGGAETLAYRSEIVCAPPG